MFKDVQGKIFITLLLLTSPIQKRHTMREQDRHFLWSLYSAIAIIFLWKGIWDAIYEIPFLGALSCPASLQMESCTPFVFLFLGFLMLTLSGLIFREFDPLGGLEKGVAKTMRQVYHHPQRKEFAIKYHDKAQKKDWIIPATRIRSIEHNALVLKHHQKRQELFIPLHRIKEVLHHGKSYWRL